MELQVSKWCFECGYTELLWQVPITNFVSITMNAEQNQTCRHCGAKNIRLDIVARTELEVAAQQLRMQGYGAVR
jgi:predicted nucleic-acid-binding Zn-ribbon protein